MGVAEWGEVANRIGKIRKIRNVMLVIHLRLSRQSLDQPGDVTRRVFVDGFGLRGEFFFQVVDFGNVHSILFGVMIEAMLRNIILEIFLVKTNFVITFLLYDCRRCP
jgi:hypothetical protein